MTRSRRLVHFLTHLGVPPEMSAQEAKYIVLSNTLAIFSTLMGMIILLGGALLMDGWLSLAVTGFSCVVYLSCLWLNHRRWHAAAIALLGIASAGMLTWQRFWLGQETGVLNFMFVHAVATLLCVSPRHTRVMPALCALYLVWFLGVDIGFRDVPARNPPPPAVVRSLYALDTCILFVMLMALGYYSRRATLDAEASLEHERQRADELLRNILPTDIAQRLKGDHHAIADSFADVTVLFADIAGFTPLAARLPPSEVVALLNSIFTAFDQLADEHGLEKIKTIGDAYMAAAGVPLPRADHAAAAANLALAMVRVVETITGPDGQKLAMRIGMHSGPVVAGVIGRRKFSYDLWGDTVNTASRMESHGASGAIHVTGATYEQLKGLYTLERRGTVEVKGKGPMETWWLRGPAAARLSA